MDKLLAIDIIVKQEIDDGGKAGKFNYKDAGIEAKQVQGYKQQAPCEQLHIINYADDFEIVSIQVMIYKFDRGAKMKPVGDYDFWMIFIYCNLNRVAIGKRINLLPIYHHSYLEKA